MKILLNTTLLLLTDADDVWIELQSCNMTLDLHATLEEPFFESEYEDESGLFFEYKAYAADNKTATLTGHTLTLIGREDDGDTYEFDVSLLQKWDAESYLGRDAQ